MEKEAASADRPKQMKSGEAPASDKPMRSGFTTGPVRLQ